MSAEELLLKYARPVLTGVGLIVILNLWNIVQVIWQARKAKDGSFEKDIAYLKETVIKSSYRMERLERDLNNVARLARGPKNG